MDSATGTGGLVDEQEPSTSETGGKVYHRYTPHQIGRLEERAFRLQEVDDKGFPSKFFVECSHPNEEQRRLLGMELGLETKQIKFWFQNKRTQIKTQNERLGNTLLREENERLILENLSMREALRKEFCLSCGGLPCDEESRQHRLQILQLENATLLEEYHQARSFLAVHLGNSVSNMRNFMPLSRALSGMPLGSFIHNESEQAALDDDLCPRDSYNWTLSHQRLMGIPEMEKSFMKNTAANAMTELIMILKENEPLWVKFPGHRNYTLDCKNYQKVFPTANHLKTLTAHLEVSKYSGLVAMSGFHLVDMFLDAKKWADLFPTVVTKAKTIHLLENGIAGNHDGSLQLMYEQMHTASPFVPSREFYFLRYCRQIEERVWVIADVSYDISKECHSWRLPSGCMIHETSNGLSEVTWVEHVEVDDQNQTHRLYKDFVSRGFAYGAERWITTLQRMCDRLRFSSIESASTGELRVINLPEQKSNIMKLSQRMVKNFCLMLSMPGGLDFPQLRQVTNSGARVHVRKNTDEGQPRGTIISAAVSFWLPVPVESVYHFLRDEKRRAQWDVLSRGNSMPKFQHIPTGLHPGNEISIVQLSSPTEENMVVLQESYIDALGSLIIYAPLDIQTFNSAMNGEESSVPILPSGIVIFRDDRPISIDGASTSTDCGKTSGSIITMAYQVLSSCAPTKQHNVQSVASVATIISSTIDSIKFALNCKSSD